MAVAKTDGTVSNEILERLRGRIGPEKSRKYLSGPSRLVRDGDEVSLAVESAFLADLLQRRFGGALAEITRESLGDSAHAKFIADPALRGVDTRGVGEDPAPPVAAVAAAAGRKRTAHGAERTGARPNSGDLWKRLDTMIVGDCNRLAIDAARRVATSPGPSEFCPLFVHGACGLGKTHLLQGIADLARRSASLRVSYTTGETFTNAFISSLQARRIDEFRRRFRRIDVLCIDDVHFLSQKNATQEEFLHTFDAIGATGARIILASDEHPRSIERLQERLVSRFLAGMVVELDTPDAQTRRQIVKALCAQRAVGITEDAADALAARVRGSVRDLEGAITRSIAIQRLLESRAHEPVRVGVGAVERALGPSVVAQIPRRPVRIDVITQVVCDALKAPVDEVLGGNRHRRVVLARSLAAHLARKLTTQSFPEIARALNRPNHSTIVTACQRVERRISAGEQLDADTAGFTGAMTLAELVETLADRACRAGAGVT